LLAGCASKPELQLVPGARAPEALVDLSGYWSLRDPGSDPLLLLTQKGFIGPRSAEQVIRITKEMRASGRSRRGGGASRSSGGNRDKAALAQVFLETGSDVKITQTHEGMFISFDRSIVEEYLFGEHRIATVGPISAERASGWSSAVYVIETLDEDEVLLRERWFLEDDALNRGIEFIEKDEVVYTATQVFDRRDGPG
jgi:hypothetical protein